MKLSDATTPPIDLLERCLETIPVAEGAKVIHPRPLLESRSRTRLLWLGAMAAVPVIAVLVVLPIKKYRDTQKLQVTSLKESNSGVGYVRIEIARRINVTRKWGGTWRYELQVFDENWGQYRAYTKRGFREAIDQAWVQRPAKSEDIQRTLEQQSISFGSARDEKVQWEGRIVRKYEIVHYATQQEAKQGIASWRSEFFRDPETNRIQGSRRWLYFDKDPHQIQEGILGEEVHYYYDRRPITVLIPNSAKLIHRVNRSRQPPNSPR